MAGQNTAIFGIYPDKEGVERAVGILPGSGVRNTDISFLLLPGPENAGARSFALPKGSMSSESTAAGVVVGGAGGWLVGMGVLAVPGLGSFLVAGPIVTALAGIGPSGGAGLASALISLGVSEYEAKSYEDRIRCGCILMSVHCGKPECAKRAKQILQETGAEHITSVEELDAGAGKSMLRHLTRRSKRLSSVWKFRSPIALRAHRKNRGLVRVDRFWKGTRMVHEALRVKNRSTIAGVSEDLSSVSLSGIQTAV